MKIKFIFTSILVLLLSGCASIIPDCHDSLFWKAKDQTDKYIDKLMKTTFKEYKENNNIISKRLNDIKTSHINAINKRKEMLNGMILPICDTPRRTERTKWKDNKDTLINKYTLIAKNKVTKFKLQEKEIATQKKEKLKKEKEEKERRNKLHKDQINLLVNHKETIEKMLSALLSAEEAKKLKAYKHANNIYSQLYKETIFFKNAILSQCSTTKNSQTIKMLTLLENTSSNWEDATKYAYILSISYEPALLGFMQGSAGEARISEQKLLKTNLNNVNKEINKCRKNLKI